MKRKKITKGELRKVLLGMGLAISIWLIISPIRDWIQSLLSNFFIGTIQLPEIGGAILGVCGVILMLYLFKHE